MQAGRNGQLAVRTDRRANGYVLVDAARCYERAIELLKLMPRSSPEAATEIDELLTEAQSSLFWCHKQMNADQLIALRSSHPLSAPTPATAAATGDAETPGQADPAAGTDAPANPEAADGPTPAATKADIEQPAAPPSLHALPTLFTALAEPPTGPLLAEPSDNRRNRLRQELRSQHPDTFDAIDARHQRLLARDFLADALLSTEPDRRYVLLTEVGRLASSAGDPALLVRAATELNRYRGDRPGQVLALRWASRLPSREMAKQVQTLIAKPTDAAANHAVGAQLCFLLDAWDQGLPMLGNGTDETLVRTARRELDESHTTVDQCVALATAWEQAGRETTGLPEWGRVGCRARAATWLRRATTFDDAGPAVREQLARLDRTLPVDPARVDWALLSPEQWDRLPGRMVMLRPLPARIGPVASLAAQERMRVVLHPSQPQTSVAVQVGSGVAVPAGEITGPGAVFLIVAAPATTDLQVKLVPLDGP